MRGGASPGMAALKCCLISHKLLVSIFPLMGRCFGLACAAWHSEASHCGAMHSVVKLSSEISLASITFLNPPQFLPFHSKTNVKLKVPVCSVPYANLLNVISKTFLPHTRSLEERTNLIRCQIVYHRFTPRSIRTKGSPRLSAMHSIS